MSDVMRRAASVSLVCALCIRYTTAQAAGLQQNLVDMGYTKAKTYFAMRYWEPYTEDVSAPAGHAAH